MRLKRGRGIGSSGPFGVCAGRWRTLSRRRRPMRKAPPRRGGAKRLTRGLALRNAGGDFGGEVAFLLLDALAELEADDSPSSAIGAPTFFASAATTSSIFVLLSMTKSWERKAHFLAELGDRRPRPSSRRCSAGLPDSCRLFRARSRARARSGPDRDPRRAAPAGRPRRCASRAACRASRARPCRRVDSSATSTPILPRPGAAALWT